MMTATMFEINN